MTDLKKLVKELAETQKRASYDLEAAPHQTRSSLTNMVRDAQEQLEKLKAEYTKHIRANSLGMFMSGDAGRVASFCRVASEEAGVIIIAADGLYRRLASKISGSLGANRDFGPTQLQGLMEGLRDVFGELGIRNMKMPALKEITVANSEEDVVGQVRALIRAAVDDELLRHYVDRKINDAAVEGLFSGTVLPVAVTGLIQVEVASLAPIFTNSISVEVGTSEDGAVDKEYVLKRLTSFKKKLKSKINNEPAE